MRRRNPWKRVLANVMLSAEYGCFGGSARNPKNRPDKCRGSQSTKRHKVFVNAQDLERKFNEQGGRCFWLGVPINPNWVYRPHFVFAPSVDRLDNEKDYEYDNIVISTRFANVGRRNTKSGVFAKMVKALAKHGINPNMAALDELIRLEETNGTQVYARQPIIDGQCDGSGSADDQGTPGTHSDDFAGMS